MRTRVVLGVVLAVLGTTPVLSAPPSASAEGPRIAPHEILVLGRPSASGRPGLSPASPPFTLTQRARALGLAVAETRPLFAGREAGRAFPGGAWILRLEPGTDPEAAAARLARDPDVAYAGPNHVWRVERAPNAVENGGGAAPARRAPAIPPGASPLAVTPDDSLFADQYGLVQSRVTEAWEHTRGEGIVIAIIDTGVDTDHPDLVTQFAINAAEAAGQAGVDDDGNGFVDDILGYDFTDAPGMPGSGDFRDRDPDPQDEHGHGTEVAGVAAAAFDNGIGVAGVAPGARILPLRAAFSTPFPFISALLQEDDIAAAILYATERGAQIINMSFGDVVRAPVVTLACAYARSRGVLLVAGAGNTGADEPFYPAANPGVLAAGACNNEGTRTGFSTFGQDLDYLAAGMAMVTTRLGGTYKLSSGTSFSSPFSAGVAALVWSVHPGWTADEVAWTLRLTAQGAGGGWTAGRGWGIVDAAAAVAAANRPPVVQPQAAVPGDDGLRVDATVAHPALASWTLSAVPESSAVAAGTPLSPDAVVLAAGTGQAVAESVAVFTPPADGAGLWVLNLAAAVSGFPPITKRLRIEAPPAAMSVQDLVVGLVVGEAGWDVIASWTSPEPYQGAVQSGRRFVSENSVGCYHGVHVFGPMEPGPDGASIRGRITDYDIFRELADTLWTVPPREQGATASASGGLPPGTPMPETANWDGDGFPEVLVEAPPTTDTYGAVSRYELAGPDIVSLQGTSTYRGIPLDTADADGDGRAELLVYRVDGWSVWEAAAPGAFPDQPVALPPEATGTPLGFVDTGSGIRLLVEDDRILRAFRLDPAAGFAPAGEDSAAVSMGRPNAAGDFDGDGRLEVAVSGLERGVALFEVTDAGVAAEGFLDVPYPVVALRSRTQAGGPDALFSVEADPGRLAYEGDLDRSLSRLRRWDHDGTRLAASAALSFAGLDPFGDVQLLDLGGDLVLRRRQRFDVVTVTPGAVGWGGVLARASIPATGSVLVAFGGGPTLLWAGSSDAAIPEGEGFTVVPDATLLGDPLTVWSAASVPGGVRVAVGWSDPCASTTLTRSGGVRGSYAVPVVAGQSGIDTLAVGESVTFTATSPSCPPRTLLLTGRDAPLPIRVFWEGAENLIVDFPRPLAGSPGSPGPPETVAILGNAARIPILGSQVDHEGTRLRIRVGAGADADSLVLGRARYADGYPVGGAMGATGHSVPPRPAPAPDPVLAAVAYRGPDDRRLDVALGGSGEPCPEGFVLEPLGTLLTTWSAAPAGADHTLEIPLDAALATGDYTLRFADACRAGRASPLGTERSFTVTSGAGVPVVYPNPVPPGVDLVIENVERGSRVEIHDLRGAPRVTFITMDAPVQRRPVTDLAPGLYILRIEDTDGRLLLVQKLFIRR
jgi:subtilisin family serine protease